jgi:hypothetical protein
MIINNQSNLATDVRNLHSNFLAIMCAGYMNLSKGSTGYWNWIKLGKYLHIKRKNSPTTTMIFLRKPQP